jgi:small-conductance mechanosensitive channel
VNAADQERLRAEEAKRNFEAATGEVGQRLQEDNQLKDALREQLETNRKLREQLEQTKPKASPPPSQSSSSTDALKQWGEQLNRPNGPTPAGTPTH